MTPQQRLAELAWQGAAERFSKSPSPAMREREGPTPQAWEGEGFSAAGTLTRLRPAASGTLSRGAGEGLLADGGEGDRDGVPDHIRKLIAHELTPIEQAQ